MVGNFTHFFWWAVAAFFFGTTSLGLAALLVVLDHERRVRL